MVEVIVISKSIVSSIIWRVYVDALYPSLKPTKNGCQREKIVATDDKIIILTVFCSLLFAISRIFICRSKDFGIEKPVHLILCETAIIEYFLPSLIFLRLPTLKNAIFIREYKFYSPGRGKQITHFISKANLILKACVAVRQELAIVDHPSKAGFIEHLYAVDIGEKASSCLVVRKEDANKIRVHFHCSLINGITKNLALCRKEPVICFQYFNDRIKKVAHVRVLHLAPYKSAIFVFQLIALFPLFTHSSNSDFLNFQSFPIL